MESFFWASMIATGFLWILGIVLLVLWVLLPFVLIGISKKLQKIGEMFEWSCKCQQEILQTLRDQRQETHAATHDDWVILECPSCHASASQPSKADGKYQCMKCGVWMQTES
jgi:hypothetical protein